MQTPGEKEQRVQEEQRRQAQIDPTTGDLEPIPRSFIEVKSLCQLGDLSLG